MVSLSSLGGAGWQFFDSNGTPLAGGKLYTYAAGTTTPAATYTTYEGTPRTENPNPIILDSAGRPPQQIWLESADEYKFVLTTAADNPIWTKDNIPAINAALVNITTTTIANGLGAAAAPSYTFTGDLNTGIWSPAADTVAVSTAGVERMRISSAGLVGIGSITYGSSGALLDVNSTTLGFLPPRMTTAQRDAIASGAPDSGLIIYNTQTDKLQVYSDGLWRDLH